MKKKGIVLGLILSLTFSGLGFAAGSNDSRLASRSIENAEIASDKKVKVETKLVEEKENGLEIRVEMPIISGLDKEFESSLNKKIEKDIRTSLEDFKSEARGKSGIFNLRYYVEERGDLISLVIEEDRNLEVMANSQETIRTYNIDSFNNREIKLKDLFRDGSNYKEIIEENIRAEIKNNSDRYFQDEEGFKGLADDDKFYLDRDMNLFIVYDQEVVAPHSSGLVKFKIEADKLAGVYKSEGRIDEEAYINERYGFSYIIPPAWTDYVTVEENLNPKKGLFEVDFIFTPSNKKDPSFNFFTLEVRKKDDLDFTDEEGLLGKGDYLYVGNFKARKELPYEEGTKTREEFIKVNEVLDGAEELLIVEGGIQLPSDLGKLIINGELVDLEDPMYVDENRELMLPFRELGEKMGYKVTWDHENRLAGLEKLPVTAGTYVGTERNYYLNSQIDLETRSELVKTKTYVPKTFYSDVLKLELGLNEDGILKID